MISPEDFAPELVEDQLNIMRDLQTFTDAFLKPFEDMRALESNEAGTISQVSCTILDFALKRYFSIPNFDFFLFTVGHRRTKNSLRSFRCSLRPFGNH